MAITLRGKHDERQDSKPDTSVVPVKFTGSGTPYVDSAVSVISRSKLEALVKRHMPKKGHEPG